MLLLSMLQSTGGSHQWELPPISGEDGVKTYMTLFLLNVNSMA